MQTKYVVKLYGADREYDTLDAAEVAFEQNACAAEKVGGQYVREVRS